MPLWYTRWVFTTFFSLGLEAMPRTAYFVVLIFDIVLLVFAGMTMEAFLGSIGLLIVIQEVLILLWHLSQFLLFVDYYSSDPIGEGKFSDGLSALLIYLIFACFVFSVILEFVIWYMALTFKKDQKNNKKDNVNLASDEVSLGGSNSDQSELNSKIQGYNKMKSQISNRSGKVMTVGAGTNNNANGNANSNMNGVPSHQA